MGNGDRSRWLWLRSLLRISLRRYQQIGLSEGMRQGRLKAPRDHRVAYYHCISRVVDKRFIFEDLQKEVFLKLMREYETFCGVRIITYSLMSNHFHIVLEVPKRPEQLPSDEELLARVEKLTGVGGRGSTRQLLERLRKQEQHEAAEALRERIFERMWDVSAYMKLLKQRFSQWYNKREGRKGTLWEERFKSVLVEGSGEALAAVAAYVDLNSIRAGTARDPADYRWCGYAEAMAGGQKAKEGLRIVMAGHRRVPLDEISSEDALTQYRMWLYQQGEQREKADPMSSPSRPGFSRETVARVVSENGQVSLADYLRLRVRYFSDGAVLGTQVFVDEIFKALRNRFGARRKEGGRPLPGVGSSGLFALQRLRNQPPIFG